MVSPLPSDCAEWLTSRSRIDKAGDLYRADPTSYVDLRRVQCYRLFLLTGLDAAFEIILEPLDASRILVAGRLKRLPTIVRKLNRFPTMRLSAMSDVLGIRLISESLEEARSIVALFESLEAHRKLLDYVELPQASGYRAFHEIVRLKQPLPNGQVQLAVDLEIQIRSYYQHIWSLVSESYGEQVKEGGGGAGTRSYLIELSESIREWEKEYPDRQQTSLPGNSSGHQLAVIRMIKGSKPVILPFGLDYASASKQLIRWEDDLGVGDSEALLLAGRGSLKTLGWTHAVCLGMREIPLEEWMPGPARDLAMH